MKIRPLLLFIVIYLWCILPVSARHPLKTEIIGTWQNGTAELSDALLDTYTFYPNDRFTFTFNRYLEFNRIKSLSGKYKIHNDTLSILVESRKEIIGGVITNSYNPGASLGWIISGGKEKIINQKDKVWIDCILEKCKTEIIEDGKSNLSCECLRIFDNRYYKIQNNPFELDEE